MEYKNIFGFDNEWNLKTISLLAFLAIFPNVFGMLHTTIFGVRIHFFQYLIFLAAIIYGPIGGAVSGAFGSIWTAVALNNPYILIGNVILGFFVGYFVRLKWYVMLAVLGAYLIQLPWLWVTDVYLAHMPVKSVRMIVIALLLSNVIWGSIAGLTSRHIKKAII